MRILIAIGVHRQKEAGAAAVVLNHASELERRGHKVDCWFLEDVLTRAVAPRFEALRFAVAISRRIRKEPGKYDVVNLHAPSGCIYGLYRRFWGRSNAPPCVMTMQGSEERYVCAMRLEHRKGKASNFALKNRLWHRLYHQTMYDLSIKTADYGAVANREAWICAELKYKRPPGHIWYVPNGTEERFFIEREYPEKTLCDLLYVGTWLDRKGIYYLAEAFSAVSRKFEGIQLTVAGSSLTQEQVRDTFAPVLRGHVRVIPFVSRADILSVYAQHDVFVFPSLMEGMPLTLLEAMATGMPAVTTCTSGMADVVEDGVNGLLVPPADAEALADGVEKLCRSKQLRIQLGRAAQETMRRYTWSRIGEKMEEVLALALRTYRRQTELPQGES